MTPVHSLHATILLICLCVFGVTVSSASPPTSEQILIAARNALAEGFPADAHRLKLRIIRTGGNVDDTLALRVIWPSHAVLPRARTQVDVLTRQAGRWHKSGWALLYVSQFDSVVVARTNRRKDELVNPEDVQYDWREITTFRGTPLHPNAFRTFVRDNKTFAAHPLHTNHLLRSDDLRPDYSATTGAAVEMRYQRGHITFNLTCKAREPGFEGDIIRLYNTDTDVTYRARLTGPGTADWIETR